MFKSGQALGGHKRSHFINGSMDHYAAMGHATPSWSEVWLNPINLPSGKSCL
ncbi:hypothetical protein HanPSC8_Chr10g0412631 [Helianthus annuus]|nr:hypothetical protein HanPSC8_Chr10g0412631 [Helianthus annuus]